MALERAMLCAFHNFILNDLIQVYKILTKTSYANQKVAVLFRMFLCILQHLLVYHIELNFKAPIIHEGFNEVFHCIFTFG